MTQARIGLQLEDVLHTAALKQQPRRPGQKRWTDVDLPLLAVDDTSRDVRLASIVRIAMELTGAESAGISCFASKYDELTWISVTGRLNAFAGRRFPRRHSMCGVCFATGEAQLFAFPHRYFQWMEQNGLIMHQALLIPLRSSHGFAGTLWVSNHSHGACFNRDDLGILERLAPALAFL